MTSIPRRSALCGATTTFEHLVSNFPERDVRIALSEVQTEKILLRCVDNVDHAGPHITYHPTTGSPYLFPNLNV